MASNTLAAEGLHLSGNKPAWQDADRWMFVFMAGLFLLIVLTGFIPSSIGKIAAVQSGERAPFLTVLHVHAFLMGTWILLLLTQASLVATKHGAIHQRLGMSSMVLMPAMVATGFLLVPANFGLVWGLDPSNVPSEVIAQRKEIISNIALAQIRTGILFPIIVSLALYFRKKDLGTHKRLMILATVIPIPAALDRISWLPNTMPFNPIAPNLYVLLLIFPLFAYDLLRHRTIPRAYMIWGAVWAPSAIVVYMLWGSSWWLSIAPKIMGVESW
ncbi:MAG: hypothetical protein JKY29_12480 [Gammaproteobacteria bacterium]|nr:hypothetical protein [Gammaproteobacteria bacterium]